MSIDVRISNDNMEAVVEVERRTEQTLDAEAIKRALAEAGVKHGVEDKACIELADAVGKLPAGGRVSHRVAHGSLPIDGEDGRIEMAVEYVRNPVGMLRDHGTIDFHERGSFTPIAKGQLIAKIVLPTPGSHGKNVRGEEIKPDPGKPARFTAGQGTKVEANGTELRAIRAGDLRCIGELVEVLDMIRVTGDLDYSVGSIECEGPVRVQGDVLPGFHIRAGGDVWIGGVVDSAEVTSHGSVTIAGGVVRGSCISGKRGITVRYARESYLESSSIIRVSTEVVNCIVISGDTIAIAAAGRAVGGRVVALNRIEAGVAGHVKGIPTVLAGAVNPYDELRAAKLETKIGRSEALEAWAGKMKDVSESDRHPALDQLRSIQASKREQNAEELAKLKQTNIQLANCRIEVKTEVHSGVSIRIGPAEMTIKEDQRGTTFYYDADSGEVVSVRKTGDA